MITYLIFKVSNKFNFIVSIFYEIISVFKFILVLYCTYMINSMIDQLIVQCRFSPVYPSIRHPSPMTTSPKLGLERH